MLQLPQKSISVRQSLTRQLLFSKSNSDYHYFPQRNTLKCPNVHHRFPPMFKIEHHRSLQPNWNRKSMISSVSSLSQIYDQVKGIETFKEEERSCNYFSLDLTWALANLNISNKVLFTMFGMLVFVRYLTVVVTIYYIVHISFDLWEVLILLLITSFLYCTCMIKTSLKPAQTDTEIVLKASFNCLDDSQALKIFQIVSKPKLLRCFLRGILPPELSFFFITGVDQIQKKRIYIMINYIYCSIEAVIYIPGYLIYYYIRYVIQQNLSVNLIYLSVNTLLLFSWVSFMMFNIYLICLVKKDNTSIQEKEQ